MNTNYNTYSTAPPQYELSNVFQTHFIPISLSNSEKFNMVCEKYEISEMFASKLKNNLTGVEIILILDNSSSMNELAHEGTSETRWQELKKTCDIVISIASSININGVNIYFLNPQCGKTILYNITDSSQLNSYFNVLPVGGTKLTETLDMAINDKKKLMDPSQKLLVIIATDGEPTGIDGVKGFKDYLKYIRDHHKIFVTILACTDDKVSLKYLNKLDKEIPGVDVLDDYINELEQIRKVQGKNFRFTYGDYIAKCLLSSSDKEIDDLDERKSCSCIII